MIKFKKLLKQFNLILIKQQYNEINLCLTSTKIYLKSCIDSIYIKRKCIVLQDNRTLPIM